MSFPWSGKRILIVDDSKIVRDQLASFYSGLGLVIAGFAIDGVGALAKAEELAPDIISLDIIMPEMDGIECFRALTKKGMGTRCLFVTSLAAEPRVLLSYTAEIPAELFLGKPVTVDALKRGLEYFYRTDEPAATAAVGAAPLAVAAGTEPPVGL